MNVIASVFVKEAKFGLDAALQNGYMFRIVSFRNEEMKIFPLLMRRFNFEKRIQFKLLELLQASPE